MELTTIYKEIKNEEKNGIELYFEAIPTKEEREALKANGYKWHNTKKCWYKKQGASVKAPKVEKWQNITAFEIAKDFDTFSKLFLLTHDYLTRCNEATRQKDLEYFYKKYLLFTTNDGHIIQLEKDFSIDKTLWYDDETDAPENTFENFRLYNIRNADILRRLKNYLEQKKSLEEGHGASGCYDYKGLYLWKTNDNNGAGVDWCTDYLGNEDRKIRYLTDEEQEQFVAIVEQITKDYEERLQRYWKRYGQHVHWCGYWVNR